MEILVNGAGRAAADGSTVADLVRELGLPDRGVAVAVDDAVVPKGRWATVILTAGARVEVLTAVQGG